MSVPDPTPKNSWRQTQLAKWKRDVAYVIFQARTLTFLFKHSQTPWHARIVAACSVGYLVSPIQLIPTFIPVIGQMDDLLVLFVGMKILRKLTPGNILAECEAQARASVFMQTHASKAVLLATQEGSAPAA